MKGYNGKMLWVDLTSKTTKEKDIPNDWYTKFVGGEGFTTKILYDNLTAETKPLGEDNMLVFATGPLNGTLAPCSGRLCVGYKSPLTGTIGASNVGGHLAPVLKKTGYDVIVITGKSEKPLYVYVKDSTVEFKEAGHIWGLDTEETEEKIREELGNEKVRIAEIGPAGENLVKYSSIMIDSHRAAGRGGAGAVMGSKNLKALVCYGTSEKPKIANKDAFKEYCNKARQELKDEPFVRELLSKHGTPTFTDAMNAIGCLPTRNWQQNTFDAMDKLGHEAFHKTLKVKAWACHACPIACGRETEILEGKYKGEKGGGPEYEGVAAFGSKTCVDDLNDITMTYYLCNRYGIDIISAGQVISTAMEWYEKGIIDKGTTDGIELAFGNGDSMVEMIKKIAFRDGFGDILAEGVMRAAQKIGGDAEKYAFHVKGMEMAADGVRGSKAETLVHMTSERGADHLRPFATTIDGLGYLEPELGITEKKSPIQDSDKKWVKPFKELCMLTNLLGSCLFASITIAVKGSTWTGLYNSVTGEEFTLDEMLKCAERVSNLQRLFNGREGFGRKDDTIPERFVKEPALDGVGKGQVVNPTVMLDEYYEAMGWNKETGLPTEEKLRELDLLETVSAESI